MPNKTYFLLFPKTGLKIKKKNNIFKKLSAEFLFAIKFFSGHQLL